MKVFLNDTADGIIVQARAEGPGMIGDMVHCVRPGESFANFSFDELKQLGPGEHDLIIEVDDVGPDEP